MLILHRRDSQSILIGNNIEIKMLGKDTYGGYRLGIEAPKDVLILRKELLGIPSKLKQPVEISD